MEEQEAMRNAEKAGSTTRMPENTCQEMFYAIRDSLSDLARSDNEDDVEEEADDEADTELGNRGEDDGPSWVMGTVSNTVQQRIVRCWKKQMRRDKLTPLGWGDAADLFCERDMKYRMAELRVLAVVNPQPDMTTATPLLMTFGELMWTLDMVPERSEIPQGPSRPGSS